MTSKDSAYQKISSLVQRFEEQSASYKRSDYNETLTRRDFIDPFFKALGWDIDNENGYAESYREVIHEDRVKVGEATKAPDYSFRLSGGKRLFFVEAKKPSVFVKDDTLPAYQVRRYGWSAKLPISIVTDFEEFAIYDCSKKPRPSDKASTARIKYLTYQEYQKEFGFLWETFSKEKVLKGSFDKFVSGIADKKGTTTVDKEFLQSLDKWRMLLASSISSGNKNLNEDEINFAVQQTIDRIIFLRIAEDRSVEPYGKLRETIQHGIYYENLFNQFQRADERYNSGLFDFKKDKICSVLSIDNKALKTILSELYYPESPYEFSVLSVEILGSAYEQFLGKQIKIDSAHRVRIEEKPEVKKAGGVYYTPQYIVEYIVENTVGKLVENKNPKQISKIKILDPACGSGSFLIGAYDYLLKLHLNYYTQNLDEAKKANALTPVKTLSTKLKKEILLNNIFGVDIDVNAVEVTKLSLLLKCMEGETEASINSQLSFFNERVLPTLDDNIKDGNSLVDTDYYSDSLDFGQEKKIKPFNWKIGFPEVFKQNGFDVVIGNPPYVRVQSIDKSQAAYFKEKYTSAGYGSYDLYVLFLEKSLMLLNLFGVCGMILPHKFFQAEYGIGIRNLISKGKNIYQINDFTTNQIFDSATTYTCLLFLSKKSNQTFKHQKINLGSEFLNKLISSNYENISSDKLKFKWNFYSNAKEIVFAKLFRQTKSLQDISNKIFKGSSTGNDDIYLVKLISNKKNIANVFSTILNKKLEIELELLKPFLYGSDIRNFSINVSDIYLIFPYKIFEKAELIKIKILKKEYPLAQKYFESVKNILLQRKLKLNSEDFYKYSAGRSLNEYRNQKILIPDMLVEMRIGIDERGEYYHGPAIHSLVLKNEYHYLRLKYVAALLSSNLFWFFISNTSTALRGNAFRLTPDYINPFPVYIINKKNPQEISVQKEIISLVDQLISLNNIKSKTLLDTERSQINMKLNSIKNRINKYVYQLYNISNEEIKIIENS